MIVADTNLIAYLLIPGDRTGAARETLRKDPAWAAPLLWRSELRSVLALYVRTHRLALADAIDLMAEAERLLAGAEYAVESAAVLQLVEASGLAAYDCEFAQLARDLAVPLVTSDARLLRAFPGLAASPEAFARA